MSNLLGLSPSSPPIVEPITPAISNPVNKPVIVDNTIKPLSTIAQYAEGAPMHVDWVSRILTPEMALTGYDPASSPIIDQYKRYNNVIIKLQGSLSTSYSEATGRWTITGSALVHPSLNANKGDLFFADALQGRMGVYEVTKSVLRSPFAESMNEINFTLKFYDGEDDQRAINDLNTKIKAVYFFHHDYARFGINPIVTEAKFEALLRLVDLQRIMVDDFARWFYSMESGSIEVPMFEATYDPFADKFLRLAADTSQHTLLANARLMTVAQDPNRHDLTLWDVLERRDIGSLRYARKLTGIVSVDSFYRLPISRSLRFSRFRKIFYPSPLDTKQFLLGFSVPFFGFTDDRGETSKTLPTTTLPTGVVLQPIKNVHEAGYYVFSKAFWEPGLKDEEDQFVPLSLLEKLTHDYLQGEALDPTSLLWLARQYTDWPMLERYYYMPILMLLMRSIAVEN